MRTRRVITASEARARAIGPKTTFSGPHRRVAFGQLSLDDVKAFTNAHASAVNDVIVSICAGTLMAGLEELEVLLS